MRFATLASACVSIASLQPAFAYPGMDKTLREIKDKLAERQADASDSSELIGDLVTLTDAQLSTTGKNVKAIIVSQAQEGYDNTAAYSPAAAAKGSAACAADTCCIWQYIANDLAKAFRGNTGRCNELARAAVRLGFHDAAGWSKNTGPGGGADGSIILAPSEILRPANNGLQTIIAFMKTYYAAYKQYGISYADLIQTGANVATVVCPLGPRVRTFIGRKDSSVPCTDGLLPDVFASANSLIQLFADKTIKAHGLTALIGAHTTSQQQFVDPTRAGDPQDSTPGEWDVLFYSETLDAKAPKRVFKFASDVVLAADSRISSEFQKFASGNQEDWNEDYAREYVRLSLLGVNNINNLTECTKILPPHISTFTNPDQSVLTSWLNTTGSIPAISDTLKNGDSIIAYAPIVGSLVPGSTGGGGSIVPGGKLAAKTAIPAAAATP